MKNWIRTSFFTFITLLLISIGIFYIFNINLSWPSRDIEFKAEPLVRDSKEPYSGDVPKNIIIFIADGMGFSHLSLSLMTQPNEGKGPTWYEFDVKGWHDPRSLVGAITDSEASATAMSTGTSTNFGHIGINNDGEKLENIFEIASELEYTTGIVTDSYIWDGTPAAFSAHTRNEDDARDIMQQIANGQLDLIFGELEDVGEDDVPEVDESLDILKKRFQLLDENLTLPSGSNSSVPVAAIYMEDEVQDVDSNPNLSTLTNTALQYMTAQDKPFMLLVECEEMDSASHQNDSDRVVRGLASIEQTLSLILNFSKTHGETLVIFTADHETGGLAAVSDFDTYPNLQIKWATKDHSAAVVPLFAEGPGAQYFSDVHRNWEIGQRLKSLLVKDTLSN
ncbi:MAG: alkaline phosphatase [Bacteroidota bacterium]